MCAEDTTQPDKLSFSDSDFEEFLQQAELSGISPERQAELIATLLAEDIPLEEVLLHIAKDILGFFKRRKYTLVIALLLLGLVGFVCYREYKARGGEIEFQPWQFEMTAIFKLIQIKLFSWFDWNIIFEAGECMVANPYIMYLRWVSREDVDCEHDPSFLTQIDAMKYTGPFESEEYPPPLLLHDAQEDWRLNATSSLKDVHQVISEEPAKKYPMVSSNDGFEPDSQYNVDPLLALIEGQLKTAEGRPINHILMSGVSRGSNKLLRSFTQRPKFVESHVELLGTVGAIAAKNLSSLQTVHLAPGGDDMFIWVAQVLGNSNVSVKDTMCPDNSPIVFTMRPGDILASSPDDVITITLPQGTEEVFILHSNFIIPKQD